MRDLLQWAQKKEGVFGRSRRARKALVMPKMLEGQPNRSLWGAMLDKFYGEVYRQDDRTMSMAKEKLWQMKKRAKRDSSRMVCHPNELRDLGMAIFPNRAAGQDGLPSNVIRNLPYAAFMFLAQHFTQIANDDEERPAARPDSWLCVFVSLLGKKEKISGLKDFRPVALMSQIHKLYIKWIMGHVKYPLESWMPNNQYGFRSSHQAAEVIFSVVLTREKCLEWTHGFGVAKLDVSKAFDRLSHDQILFHLDKSPLNARLKYILARELFGGSLSFWAYGVNSGKVEQNRGVKQGSPESGLLFAVVLSRILWQAHMGWEQRGLGLRFPPMKGTLTHMLFADDIFLFGSCEEDLRVMMFDITVMLRNAGLDINGAKTSFLCDGGPKNWKLPGTCCNEEGLKVLGRRIDLHSPTDTDMSARIRHGLWKFSLMRGVSGKGLLSSIGWSSCILRFFKPFFGARKLGPLPRLG